MTGALAQDLLTTLPRPTTPVEVRERLLDMLRRDLVGPHPELDPDLQREVLRGTNPSNWYLTGFIGPRRADLRQKLAKTANDAAAEQQAELMLNALRSSEGMEQGAPGSGQAPDDGSSERPPMRSFDASSLGLTVLLPRSAKSLEARVTWGDYVIEPPLDESVFLPEQREKAEEAGKRVKEPPRNSLDWRRIPREERLTITLDARDSGEPQTLLVPDSAAPQVPGGGLQLVVSARPTQTAGIDGKRRDLVAVSVFLVNARSEALRRFGDVAFCFQVRLQLDFAAGFEPRDDRASYDSQDFDQRLSDLHYHDAVSYAVGHNSSGDWEADDDGRVTRVFTNPVPRQEVEKLGADIDVPGVQRGMEALAEAAEALPSLRGALEQLPKAYGDWALAEASRVSKIEGRQRQEVARKCLENIAEARRRIEGGIQRLVDDPVSREALMTPSIWQLTHNSIGCWQAHFGPKSRIR